MKNIVDVIKQKERDIQQKRSEIQQLENDMETLRAAAHLLAEDSEPALAAVVGKTPTATARPSNGEVKQFP